VIGPITRGGRRALGIAQFMPGTAAERGLSEPLNPSEALPKSGEFLAALRDQFGNIGLAAAAYNAGPQRVRDFISGLQSLPEETRNYVRAITNRSVEDWATPAKEPANKEFADAGQHTARPVGCRDVVALLEQTPRQLGADSQERLVPGWCKSLHHPNTRSCGTVHLRQSKIDLAAVMKPRSHVTIPRVSSL